MSKIKLTGKQKEILYLPEIGHSVVCGVAGSGKSTCAIERAKYIQRKGKVLLLTFNRALSNYINDLENNSNYNIDIKTYHQFATDTMKKVGILGYKEKILQNKNEKISEVLEIIKRKYPEKNIFNKKLEFFIDEISWMQKFGVLKKEEYENIERLGRKNARLLREERKYVFMVYEEYIKLRKKNNMRYDWDDCAYYLNEYLKENEFCREYESIIIDEGQDFSPMMIKSIVNYMKNDGSILYLADKAQQIYGKGKLSWKQLGLNIKKVYTLEENYRNTKSIAIFSNSIREKLDLEEDDGLLAINNNKEGNKPLVKAFNSREDEDKYVINCIKYFIGKGSTCIITQKNLLEYYEELLSKLGVSSIIIRKNTSGIARNNGVFITNYHSAKGLEFDNVIIPCCSNDIFNNGLEVLENDAKEEKKLEIAKLIYVGITRAKENLVITYCGELIDIITKDNNICNFE